MPRVLELKEIDGRLAVFLDYPPEGEGGAVSLWTEDEAAKQAKDSEELGREQGLIAGLKEALEILSPDSSSAPETWAYAEAIRARISILEKGTE